MDKLGNILFDIQVHMFQNILLKCFNEGVQTFSYTMSVLHIIFLKN